MHRPIWSPTPEKIDVANVTLFRKHISNLFGLDLNDYDELYEWSIDEIESFWEAVWSYSNIVHSRKYESILQTNSMLESTWFTGARLNFAENLLRYTNDEIALTFVQNGNTSLQQLTYNQLYSKVAKAAHSFRRYGIKPGDRIAAFMPNKIETVVAMLAATSIGAIWSSCSPDFGFNGVIQRFEQIEPTILIATDGYYYGDKTIDCTDKIAKVLNAVSSIKKLVMVPYVNNSEKGISSVDTVTWDELLLNDAEEIDFEQLPFDHPVYIMYSSGTTGVPKCMVHGAGGTLLQHAKELKLHCNLTEVDTIFYYTTCGWMMWNWLVSSLMCGSRIILYDGNPLWPQPDILWKMADDLNITVFGTSAKYISLCMKHNLNPGKTYDLQNLRALLSTGSPLSTDGFEWVYGKVKQDIHLASISGGTDIISCFILGDPTSPVYTGEIQKRGLGMKIESWNDLGEPVTGEKGELVCTAPFPSMPVSFWNDPDDSKYFSAYFDHFPGVWRHGDYIEITEHNGIIVHGRSDATLNPGGVRLGTAELYKAAESMDEVQDSLAVGQQYQDDVRVILFVVLKAGLNLDEELQAIIKATIRKEASPHHVPAKIISVKEIPMTINGKKVEMAVSNIIHGKEVKNKDSLINPEALEYFTDLPELQS